MRIASVVEMSVRGILTRKKSAGSREIQDGGAHETTITKQMSTENSQSSDNRAIREVTKEDMNVEKVFEDASDESEEVNETSGCITCQAEPEKMIECGRCAKWECLDCSQMGERFYEMLNDPTIGPRTHWFCRNCEEPAIKAVKTDKEIEVQCKTYMERFAKVYEKGMADMKKDIGDIRQTSNKHSDEIAILQKECSNNKQEIDSLSKKQGATTQETSQLTTNEAVKEVEERQNRKLNVVFFNVEESQNESHEERKNEDAEAVRGILDALSVQTPFSNPTRLGKKESDTATRPLRIKVTSQQEVNSIMEASKNLRGTPMQSIFINRDKTPLERAEWRKLLGEKKQKNEEAEHLGREENWVIRNSKVVLGRPREKRQ